MNTPLKSTLIAAFLAITIPAANMAFAEHGEDKGGRCEKKNHVQHGKHQGAPYLKGLDLTSTQNDQLFALNHAQVPMMRDLQKQHKQIRDELRAISQADNFNEEKAQQLAEKAAKLEKEKVLAFARHEAKIFALLTPEQRKKAREFKMQDHGFGPHEGHGDNNNNPTRFNQHHRDAKNHDVEKRRM